MKFEITLNEIAMMKAIIQNTPWTKTEIAKILFQVINAGVKDLQLKQQALIATYEVEMEVPVGEPVEGEPQAMETRKQVPQEKIAELNTEMRDMTIEIEFKDMIYPALKQAIINFPEVVVDQQGNKGLRGEGDIMVYEDMKDKFCK